MKGERVAAAQGERVAAGRWIGGQRPFGWQLDPDPALAGTPLSGRKVLPRVDEHEAAEVRRLTDELLAGTSLASLVRDLNERGITTTTGKRWSSISLRRVLTRPRNFGAVSYAGELVRATWPAIVPEAKVQRVMQLLADPERRTSTTNVARYLLSGIATCGRCGAKVKTGQSRSQRGQPRRLYQCSQGDHVWRAVRVADHVVVSTVLIRLQSMSPEKRMALLAPDADPELEAEASRLRARIETYLDLLDSGDITKAQFRDRRSKAMAALKVIERKQAQASSAPVLSEIMSAEDVRASWDATPFDRQRSILDTLVGVAINPGAKIRSNSALNQQTAAVAVTWKLGFPEDDAWTRLIEG